jgi:hypothetical protein
VVCRCGGRPSKVIELKFCRLWRSGRRSLLSNVVSACPGFRRGEAIEYADSFAGLWMRLGKGSNEAVSCSWSVAGVDSGGDIGRVVLVTREIGGFKVD